MKRLVVLCVLGSTGCPGDGPSAVQKCDDLISDVCDRGVECIPQQTGTHANCVQMLEQVLSCGSAKRVSMTYDRCIQQIKADGCQVLFPTNPSTGQPALTLPADCQGVILMLEPGDPTPVAGSSPFSRASQLSTVSGP